jgi:O-antigen/teichoic acid export membrane protein
MPSLKKNFFYSALLTVANYIFPLITYPYVSRVLGVTNIGICNFVDNIVNYFLVFSTMGISILGVREIAGAGTDQNKRNSTFSSLLTLNAMTTFVAAVVLTIAIFVVPSLAEYRKLLFVGVAKLLANSLFLEWLFRGLEEFKFITSRSILIKALYVVAVFLFIKEPGDYGIYYLLLTVAVVLNALVNAVYSRRFVRFSLHDLRLGDFAKPYFVLGVNFILTSMYTSFNVICLGFMQDPEQVGFYTSATKVLSIFSALLTACTTVLLPRMSAVLSEGKMEEFEAFINNTLKVFFLVGIPLVFLIEATAADIIRVLSGAGYEGAILPLKTIAPLVLVVGLEEILIVQVMMPRKMDRGVLRNSVLGAVTGTVLNLALVKTFQAEGSAIVWLCSECAVLCGAFFAVFGRSGNGFPGSVFLRDLLVYVPLLLILLVIQHLCGNLSALLRLTVCAAIAGVYFLVVSCWIDRNPVILGLLQPLTRWKR